MRWEGRRRSTNVEDRRRSGVPRRFPRGGRKGAVRRAGGSSIVVFIVIAIALWIFAGIHPLKLIEMIAGGQTSGPVATQQEPRTPAQQAADDERAEFMKVVLAETEDTWGAIFGRNDMRYSPPRLVLYSGFDQSACGFASAAAGPFYCPADRTVYVDLSFFDRLSQRFDAPGDFAQAYVLAHEVGHHVQNLTGVLREFAEMRARHGEARTNEQSIRVELQADCYAGVWANAADRVGILEEGDVEEALGAAAAVGDDMMQRRSQGYVVPESFNHGTAEQRARWFRIGYQSGNPNACDTVEASSP